jgi:tetratricopeptide (TPR) repeat protein
MNDKKLDDQFEDFFADLTPDSPEEDEEGEPSLEETLLTNLLGDQDEGQPPTSPETFSGWTREEPPEERTPDRFERRVTPEQGTTDVPSSRPPEMVDDEGIIDLFEDEIVVEPAQSVEAYPPSLEGPLPPSLTEMVDEWREEDLAAETASDHLVDEAEVEPVATEPTVFEAPSPAIEEAPLPAPAEMATERTEELPEYLADDQVEEEAVAEPTIMGAYPSIPGEMAEEWREGDLVEEVVVDRFDDEAVTEPAAVEPMIMEVSEGRMTMMDDSTLSDVTEQPEALPLQSTDHPLYQEVEAFINQGNWQAARGPLEELLTLYPDDAYLQEVARSVQARSALLESVQEITPAPKSVLARSMRYILPVVGVLVLLGLVVAVVLALQLWVLPQQAERQRARNISQIRQDAQTALASGDYDRAILGYTEILQLLPDDPESVAGLEQANQLRNTVSQYTEAIAEREAGHWENALSILEQIQAEQPNYRNVPELIASIQEQQDLSDRFAEAEAAFERGYYELAIQGYEDLQSLDYGFQRETVQDHLFLSYLQLGLAEEAAAGSDPQQLQVALDKFEQALALRPDDSQAKGESQLLRLYLASLDEFEAEDYQQTIADLTPVYEARPDFADSTAAQHLYEAKVAWADQLMDDGQFEQALATYQEANLIREIDAPSLDQKIVAARQALATPTPTPEPTEEVAPTATPALASSGSGAGPAPTATPKPQPYNLKGMSVRSNCSGFGYIHGVIWSTYGLPMAGISVQAFNTTTGLGPMVSLPTNEDGIYQIILEKDQIDGLWVVQVLENNQPASQAWGQRLGGGCINGAQELKVDWQRISELQ